MTNLHLYTSIALECILLITKTQSIIYTIEPQRKNTVFNITQPQTLRYIVQLPVVWYNDKETRTLK